MNNFQEAQVTPKSLQEVAVRKYSAGPSELAVFEFQGELRNQLVSSLTAGYLATGRYASDSRAISKQSAMALAVTGAAAGATSLSTAFSSTLFMATANPATLMPLGGGIGVGAAVMGPTGIVAQAPFIPVAASLPVVAPILAIQAITTAVILQEFKQVDRKLDSIKSMLDEALARAEATHTGELLAASDVVDEIYLQYEHCGEFSHDMLVRLALAERDVRALAERFYYLVESQAPASLEDFADVQRANYDAHAAMLSSFLVLRIAYLRVCVDTQENPKFVDASVERLKSKLESDIEFWKRLLHRSEEFRDAITVRETQLNDMNWAKRALPEFVGGKGAAAERDIATLKDAYLSTLESEKAIIESFSPLIESAKSVLASLEEPKVADEDAPTLIYWRDESGDHAFSTKELQLI